MTRILLFLVAGALAGTGVAAPRETGFLNRAITLEGKECRYQVYVPHGFRAGSALPIILALHGGGEYGTDGLRQTDVGLAHAIRLHPERFPAIVVLPQSQPGGTPGFQAFGERLALGALDSAIEEFGADRTRVYLTGFSMGGNGAWYLAYHHPERFAALIVICGFVDDYTGTSSGVHYPAIVRGAVADPCAEIARHVAHLPIWIFHGETDPTVSVEVSRRMAAALKAVGADVRYTELPGVPHNAWDPAYERADLCAWLFTQRR